jgi:hypothetical protein
MAALDAANAKVNEAWERLLRDLPNDMDEEELEELDLPDPPKQAELDAIHASIKAVCDHDRWPRELYWSV